MNLGKVEGYAAFFRLRFEQHAIYLLTALKYNLFFPSLVKNTAWRVDVELKIQPRAGGAVEIFGCLIVIDVTDLQLNRQLSRRTRLFLCLQYQIASDINKYADIMLGTRWQGN